MTSPGSLRLLLAVSLAFLTMAGNAQTAQTTKTGTQPAGDPAAGTSKAAVQYGKLPLSFEPNLGQTAKEVQWMARGPQYTLFLAGHDAVLELTKITPGKRVAADMKEMRPGVSSSAVRMNLLGAKAVDAAAGEDQQSGKANYFTGNDPSKWQRNVPMYGKVRLQGVYPGIDLVYYGHQGQLEYDFVVAPGADASTIRWGFDGAKPELAENGDLVLPVEGVTDQIKLNRPVVYQMKDGVRQPVDGSFAIAKNGEASFKLGAYDRSRELVIDPTLMFKGAIGSGAGTSVASGMALDTTINSKTSQPYNEMVLTGVTGDLDFPVTAKALQTTCDTNSPIDNGLPYMRCASSQASSAFVTKISADGTSLVYSTYLHGLSGNEAGAAVAVDSAGNDIILGSTSSNDFPITEDAYQSLCEPYFNGTSVAAICDGFFNGGGTEYTVEGPNLFIVKLDPTGSTIKYGTFFGGTGAVYPVGLALDSSDNIYFSGWVQQVWPTSSIYPNNGNQAIQYPVTSGGYQTVGLNGSQASSLSVLSADGHTLYYSTFYSSLNSASNSTWADPVAIAVGQNGIAAIGGVTLASTLPTTSGSVRPACVVNTGNTGLCWDYTGWLAVFDTTQSGDASLIYGSYIGGDEVQGGNETENQVQGLAFDSSNNLFVTGLTLENYPTTPGVYMPARCSKCGGNQFAFLSKINLNESGYVWSTLLGATNGGSQTQGNAITFDPRGWVYLYGYNNGYAWDMPVVNPVEALDGNDFAYVAVFSSDAKQLIFSTPIASAPPTVPAWSDYSISNNGVALDSSNNIYLAAYGNDSGNIGPTAGTYSTTAVGGFFRTFFAKISKVTGPVVTRLTISPLNALPGAKVTFTAAVAGTAGNTPLPTGTVAVTNNNTTPATLLGTITLGPNGAGSFNTSTLRRGDYGVTATYSGDANYETGASTQQTLVVNQLAPVVKVVTGALSINRIQALSVTVTVAAATGEPVPAGSVAISSGTYKSAAATLVAGSAKIVIPANSLNDGTVQLMATYSPNTSGAVIYRTATGVAYVKVGRVAHIVQFTAPKSPVVFGIKPIKLIASATSDLPITFVVVSGHAKVSGDLLTITGTGTIEVAATQRGNLSYNPGVEVKHAIVVDKAAQKITFAAPPSSKTLPAKPITLKATASSHLAVVFKVLSGPATVHLDTLTFTGKTGTVVIAATQAGNANWVAAPEVKYSIVVKN